MPIGTNSVLYKEVKSVSIPREMTLKMRYEKELRDLEQEV